MGRYVDKSRLSGVQISQLDPDVLNTSGTAKTVEWTVSRCTEIKLKSRGCLGTTTKQSLRLSQFKMNN